MTLGRIKSPPDSETPNSLLSLSFWEEGRQQVSIHSQDTWTSETKRQEWPQISPLQPNSRSFGWQNQLDEIVHAYNPALRKKREEDSLKFKSSLIYIVNFSQAKANLSYSRLCCCNIPREHQRAGSTQAELKGTLSMFSCFLATPWKTSANTVACPLHPLKDAELVPEEILTSIFSVSS